MAKMISVEYDLFEQIYYTLMDLVQSESFDTRNEVLNILDFRGINIGRDIYTLIQFKPDQEKEKK